MTQGNLDVGARIKLARETSAIEPSAAAFARRVLDVDAASLWRWEHGSVPSAERLHQIARATGVTVEWLLTGEGDGPKSREVA